MNINVAKLISLLNEHKGKKAYLKTDSNVHEGTLRGIHHEGMHIRLKDAAAGTSGGRMQPLGNNLWSLPKVDTPLQLNTSSRAITVTWQEQKEGGRSTKYKLTIRLNR